MRRAAKRDASEPEIVSALAEYGSKTGDYACIQCGANCRGRVLDGRGKYCSPACRSEDYRTRYLGSANPNFRGKEPRSCEWCKANFNSYAKVKKYCSYSCYNAFRVSTVKPKPAPKIIVKASKSCLACGGPAFAGRVYCTDACRASKKTITVCLECKESFASPPSANRKFCSYPCFVSNGGTVRAGLKSAEVIMKKYGAKKDANHAEVIGVLRQFCAVHDLSHAGFGVPDGVAYVQGHWHLFDIKNPKTSYGRRGLNPRQKLWAADFRGGPIYLIHNVEEAQLLAKGHFDKLTKVEAGTSE